MIFAVEAVFLFPWAVVYAEPGFGAVTAVEMGVFVAVLALGSSTPGASGSSPGPDFMVHSTSGTLIDHGAGSRQIAESVTIGA